MGLASLSVYINKLVVVMIEGEYGAFVIKNLEDAAWGGHLGKTGLSISSCKSKSRENFLGNVCLDNRAENTLT